MDSLAGKSILVTGGTGSFGKEFIHTALTKHNAERVIVFSRDELKDLIELNGGKSGASISAKTTFLIAGANMGPAKGFERIKSSRPLFRGGACS